MKYITLASERLTLDDLLAKAKRQDAIFLRQKNKIRFVLMHADEGDEEVCALQNSPEFMDYLRQAIERAKTGPTYSLEEVKAELGIVDGRRKSKKRSRRARVRR